MNTFRVEFAKYNEFGYDSFLWKRVSNSNADVKVEIILNKEEVILLSRFIWKQYVEILNEYLDSDFDYFEEGNNDDEPFPNSKRTIEENPNLINDYYNKSPLWQDYISQKFLFNNCDKNDILYYIIGFKDAKIENEKLIITFYGIKKEDF
jgi:hypothetical protein